MNLKLKYSQSLKIYLDGRAPAARPDVMGWLGTLTDAELEEFGQMVRLATRGKPIEDVVRFIAAALPRTEAAVQPTKKVLERFLVSTYSNVVLERKERLQARGKLAPKQHAHRHACSCCSAGE